MTKSDIDTDVAKLNSLAATVAQQMEDPTTVAVRTLKVNSQLLRQRAVLLETGQITQQLELQVRLL